MSEDIAPVVYLPTVEKTNTRRRQHHHKLNHYIALIFGTLIQSQRKLIN